MINIPSLIPALGLGIGVGLTVFFVTCKEGEDLIHAFASHYGGGGGGGYKGTKGFYTERGHHHCTAGQAGCVCTDPSKCRVGSRGRNSGGGGYGRGRKQQHHSTGSPARRRHHTSGGSEREFDPSEFDFEREFSGGGGDEEHFDRDNLSI